MMSALPPINYVHLESRMWKAKSCRVVGTICTRDVSKGLLCFYKYNYRVQWQYLFGWQRCQVF